MSLDHFKLWLLSPALALALSWYIIHSVPASVRRRKKEDDARDGDRRRVRSQTGGTFFRFGMRSAFRRATPHVLATDEALSEWPAYIELD